MPTLTAQSVIDKAQLVLQDSGSVHWSTAELLGWLNEAQRHIYARKKDASTSIVVLALVAGTKQTIPTTAELLLDSPRNYSGSTAGVALRKVSMQLLDAQAPDWHTHASSATTTEYMYDERVPKTFYVYPPAAVGASLELKVAIPPAEVGAAGNVVTVDDVYQPVLLDYMLYRAHSKETEVAMRDRAALYRAAVEAALEAKTVVDSMAGAEDNDK